MPIASSQTDIESPQLGLFDLLYGDIDSELEDKVAIIDVADGTERSPVVEYEVLCRRHYMRRMTSAAARRQSGSADILPFDLDLCPLPTPPESVGDTGGQ